MRRGGWIILAVGLVFVGFVFYSLIAIEPIKVVGSHLERQGNHIFVVGQVRNTADRARAIELEVHYYDRNGRPLGQDMLTLDSLQAGALREFRSPRRALDGVEDYSIYLNNGRNPYGN